MGRGRSAATIGLIETMVEIAREIQPCSVRALAYQLFNRKLIPSMSDATKVSRLSVIARESGALPPRGLLREAQGALRDLGLRRGWVVTTGRERRRASPEIEIIPWAELAAGQVELF